MDERSYLARFSNESGEFFAGALTWPGINTTLLPQVWWPSLRVTQAEFSLRISAEPPHRNLLLLTSDRAEVLHSLLAQLRQFPVGGLQFANAALQFDAFTSTSNYGAHLRVDHSGYYRGGLALSCDFRLYTAWLSQHSASGVAFSPSKATNFWLISSRKVS